MFLLSSYTFCWINASESAVSPLTNLYETSNDCHCQVWPAKKNVCLGESFPWAPQTTILEVSLQFCPCFITHYDVMLIGTYTLMVAIFSCQVVPLNIICNTISFLYSFKNILHLKSISLKQILPHLFYIWIIPFLSLYFNLFYHLSLISFLLNSFDLLIWIFIKLFSSCFRNCII